MAREIPGRVSVAKLVTVEVSIEIATATADTVQLSFLVRNEELALKTDNHCRQVFDVLRWEIAHYADWQPISGCRSTLASPVLN